MSTLETTLGSYSRRDNLGAEDSSRDNLGAEDSSRDNLGAEDWACVLF